jgi:hypothetical protein
MSSLQDLGEGLPWVRKSHKWTSSFFILEICKLKADYFNFSNLSNGRKSYLGYF